MAWPRTDHGWLSATYREEPEDRPECPECGDGTLVEDKHEECVSCDTCDYSYGTDWDAVAEARAEAREMDDHGRDTW